MTFLIVLYTLWCAWRDRKTPPKRNPYSKAALLERNYQTACANPSVYISGNSLYGYTSTGTTWNVAWPRP